ncbi:MAG: flagellar hook basal-body protein [Alphaproteobacteria bacterium]|nr:flagellar hook basal-body protein [Alphaproteobacteria bacterium]
MEIPSLVLGSYAEVLTRAMDVVANNVANVNTTGFKREGVQFDTLVNVPAPGEKINFTIDRSSYRDASMGPMITTGNPLDLSVQGEGYFPVQTQSGVQYVRGGAFQLNSNGDIITATGDKVLGASDQAINVPSDIVSVFVSSDGVVSGKNSAFDTAAVQLGKFKLVKFANEQQLQSVGNGYYTTSQAPQVATDSSVLQGMLERSNVDAVTEMTKMIEVLRSYQITAKLMDRENQRMDNAITKLSRATV